MEKNIFFKDLEEELELAESVNGGTIFKNLEEWDSLTAMVLINYCSKNFDKDLTADELETINTLDDLIGLLGKENIC